MTAVLSFFFTIYIVFPDILCIWYQYNLHASCLQPLVCWIHPHAIYKLSSFSIKHQIKLPLFPHASRRKVILNFDASSKFLCVR